MKKFLLKSVVGFLAVFALLAVLVVPVSTQKVSADSGTATYSYLLGNGPLCSLPGTPCPDIAMAPNGDTVELTGSGTLGIHPKMVTGGGTFVHKAPDGTVKATGTWTATNLLTFDSYGCGGAFPPDFCGGDAQIQVHLTPSSGGSGFDGELWIHCLIGNPPTGAMEGVRLSVPGVVNFNKEVSGDTLFILL